MAQGRSSPRKSPGSRGSSWTPRSAGPLRRANTQRLDTPRSQGNAQQSPAQPDANVAETGSKQQPNHTEHPLLDLFTSMAVVNDEFLPAPEELVAQQKERKVRSYDAPTAASAGKTGDTARHTQVLSLEADRAKTLAYYERMKRLQGEAIKNAIPEDFLTGLYRDVDHLLHTNMQFTALVRRPPAAPPVAEKASASTAQTSVSPQPPFPVADPVDAEQAKEMPSAQAATLRLASPQDSASGQPAATEPPAATMKVQTSSRSHAVSSHIEHRATSLLSPSHWEDIRSEATEETEEEEALRHAESSKDQKDQTNQKDQNQPESGREVAPTVAAGQQVPSPVSQQVARPTSASTTTSRDSTFIKGKYQQNAAELNLSESMPDPASLLPPGNRILMNRGRETLLDNLVNLQEATLNAMTKKYVYRDNFSNDERDDRDTEVDSNISGRSVEDIAVGEALWRLRKFLRKRFGDSRNAWRALENACRTVNHADDSIVMPRMAETLTTAEIKIGLSRLGIKLPAVAGYGNMRDLLNAIDEDRSGYVTFQELMGDDIQDPSLAINTPPPEREAWKSDIEQPRWHGRMRLDGGMFDQKLRKTVCQRDIHPAIDSCRPMQLRPACMRSRSEERPPLWERSIREHQVHMALREECHEASKTKETVGCTFRPHCCPSRKYRKPAQKSKSYSRRVLEEQERARSQEKTEMTFKPQLNKKSMDLARLTQRSLDTWHARLSAPAEESENRNRMGRLAAVMVEEEKDKLSGTPCLIKPPVTVKKATCEYELFHNDERPVQDRLFHHFPNEYWNTMDALEIKFDDHKHDAEERGDDAVEVSSRAMAVAPEALRRRWAHLARLNSYEMNKPEGVKSPMSSTSTRTPETRWSPSSVGFPGSYEFGANSPACRSRSAPPERGELTITYRPNLSRMVQAIRRYGDTGTSSTWHEFKRATLAGTLLTGLPTDPDDQPEDQEEFRPAYPSSADWERDEVAESSREAFRPGRTNTPPLNSQQDRVNVPPLNLPKSQPDQVDEPSDRAEQPAAAKEEDAASLSREASSRAAAASILESAKPKRRARTPGSRTPGSSFSAGRSVKDKGMRRH